MQRIAEHLGPRGLIMMVCAVTWMIIGVGVLLEAPGRLPGTFHLLIPATLRAVLWVGTAGFAAVTARSFRWSSIGCAVLLIMPCLRVLSYLGSWVMWLVPGVPDGSKIAYYYAVLHLPMVLIVLACARLPSGPAEVRSGGRG